MCKWHTTNKNMSVNASAHYKRNLYYTAAEYVHFMSDVCQIVPERPHSIKG